MTKIRTWADNLYDRKTIKHDAVAGVVLGVESVPDGLAGGLLAGVNPGVTTSTNPTNGSVRR